MPQLNITISKETDEFLNFLCKKLGESRSSIGERCLELGLNVYIEGLNKRMVFRSLMNKQKVTKSQQNSESGDQGDL